MGNPKQLALKGGNAEYFGEQLPGGRRTGRMIGVHTPMRRGSETGAQCGSSNTVVVVELRGVSDELWK
jgi:hypothetical protein